MDPVTLYAFYALRLSAPTGAMIHVGDHVHMGVAHSNPIDKWEPLIAAAATRFAVPVMWIRAVMAAESGGQTMVNGHRIVSQAGAMGLMQIMPETWSDLRARYGFGRDPFDPHDNIFAGAAYLREMYERYGYPALFAAYNAGPTQFDAYLAGANSLPDETWAYLDKIGIGLRDAVIAMGKGGTDVAEIASSSPPAPPDFASGRHLFFVNRTPSVPSFVVPQRPAATSSTAAPRGTTESPGAAPKRPATANLFVPVTGDRR